MTLTLNGTSKYLRHILSTYLKARYPGRMKTNINITHMRYLLFIGYALLPSVISRINHIMRNKAPSAWNKRNANTGAPDNK